LPYRSIDELPESVKVLPKEAQDQFLTVVNAALEQYKGDEEKAFATAWASIKQKWKKEDDKWIKKESFSWVGSIQEGKADLSWAGDLSAYPPHNILYGVAIHPIKTVHSEEWPSVRVYLEEELVKFAPTLKGAPLVYDHLQQIPEPYKVLAARYNPEIDGVEYVAYSPDWIAQKVRDGKIKNVSIEYDWRLLQNVNGVAPQEMKAVGLGILEHYFPGDPQASIMLWESILKCLKEAKQGPTPPNSAGGLETEKIEMDKVELERLLEATFKRVLKEQEDERKNQVEALQNQVKVLKDQNEGLKAELGEAKAKKQLGEAVIEPGGEYLRKDEVLRDYVRKDEIRKEIPERIPRGWGYDPYERFMRIKRKVGG